jgi:site-specific DNA-methyltransferase (adenine-specific)
MERFLNKIIHGDCLEKMKYISDRSIDMILCDLPYGTTACKWDTIIPFEPLWVQYKRIIKDNGAIVLTASQPFTSLLVVSNIRLFKCEWIWEKNIGGNPLTASFMPMKTHENILVFGKSKTKYNPQMEERSASGLERIQRGAVTSGKETHDSVYNQGKGLAKRKITYGVLKNPTTVKIFKVERGLHPTQKPVALFEYFIKTYTNPGDIVLDNCSGSGTTAIAALNTGRHFICIEKERKYIDIANKRIREHTKQLSLL